MQRIRTNEGFTLTEVLISVVVIMVGVLGFVSAISVTTLEMRSGDLDTGASLVAADQLERVRALPYDSIVSGSRTVGAYSVDWEVTGQDPKRVTLSVAFERRDGAMDADTLVVYVPR